MHSHAHGRAHARHDRVDGCRWCVRPFITVASVHRRARNNEPSLAEARQMSGGALAGARLVGR